MLVLVKKVSNGAKIRNRYNQVPHLTQDTNGKVTNSQKTPQTRAKRSALSQQVKNLIKHVPSPSSVKESVAIRVSTETVRKDMLIFRCKNPNTRSDMCHYSSQQREIAIIFYPSVKVCYGVTQKNRLIDRLIEAVFLSTHSICCGSEIR